MGWIKNKFGILREVDPPHCAASTAVNTLDHKVIAEAEIGVIQEEQIVSQFMGQDRRPIFAGVNCGADRCRRQAVAVPSGPHVGTPRLVDQFMLIAGAIPKRIDRRHINHATDLGFRAHTVAGKEPDIGSVPIFIVLVDGDGAQCHLPIGKVIKFVRGEQQVGQQLRFISRIAFQIPLRRNVEVV